ncbi:MAG TPA: hypothetical protein VKF38_08320 [Anaerolineaceae bacterium]|nr:hypothetical protein [Anaerolineaceae bacterium]
MSKENSPHELNSHKYQVVRVQTGVRIEERMLKVLKALAEYLDLSLGDLLEGIVLHAFEGKSAFSEETLEKITAIKQIYGMDYGADASHRMFEVNPPD